ncbi:MAG: ABC transporter permease [bacterium]
MFKNYLKTTLRTLARYRGFSLINIFGLALSMAVCLIIILFIREETSFDRFHRNTDRIHRINSTIKFQSGAVDNVATSPAPLAPVLREEYAGIEDVARLMRVQSVAVYKDKNMAFSGIFTEPSFLNIFSFQIKTGNAERALAEPNSAILSAETAQKFFGNKNPLGETILLDKIGNVAVTGVLEKPAGKTHFERNFDIIISFATLEAANMQELNLGDWQKSIFKYYTYVLLNKESGVEYLQSVLPQIVEKYFPEAEPGDYSFFSQTLQDIRLGPNLSNKIERQTPPILLKILAILAFILTLAACFNYMNLSVARSLKRAKEVGVRKVAGAHRKQIVAQFLGEAVIVAWIALALALILMEVWLLPAFNKMWLVSVYLGANISTQLFSDISTLLTFFGFAALVGLLAGIYPAFVLSSYLPSIVLKGVTKIKGLFRMTLRKTLIVIQFALSILFIITTLIIYRQAEHLLAADYGFDKEQVLNLAIQGNSFDVLKNELIAHPNIQNVSGISLIPGTGDWEVSFFRSAQQQEPVRTGYLHIDETFLDNLAISLITGRNFSGKFANDGSASAILNEKAVEVLQLGNPQEAIGKTISRRDGTRLAVIGVVKNFYNMSLGRIDPVAFLNDESQIRFANIKLNPGNILETIAFIENTWKKLDPVHPVAYQFYDRQLADNFIELESYLALIGVGAGFVVLIACLGLLGMATYNAETRTKEVGIRKVLGATAPNLALLLSKDFLLLIAIAVVLATPAAWYLGSLLLQNFSYRVEIGGGVFFLGIAMTFLLAFTTIASQAIRAALANPVESLRYE